MIFKNDLDHRYKSDVYDRKRAYIRRVLSREKTDIHFLIPDKAVGEEIEIPWDRFTEENLLQMWFPCWLFVHSYTDGTVKLIRMLEHAIYAGLSEKIRSDIYPLPQMDFQVGQWGSFYRAMIYGLSGHYIKGTIALSEARDSLVKGNYIRECLIAMLWRYQYNNLDIAQSVAISALAKAEESGADPVGLTTSALISALLLGDKETAIAMLERHDKFCMNAQNPGYLWNFISSIPMWSFLYDDRDRIARNIKFVCSSTKDINLLCNMASQCYLYLGDDAMTDRILSRIESLWGRDVLGKHALAEEAFRIGVRKYGACGFN